MRNKGLLERDVTKQVVDYLKLKSWILLRLHSGTVRGKTGGGFIRLNSPGTADWIAIRGKPKHQILFLEMKRENGGVVSAQQMSVALQYESQGIPTAVVSNLDDFKKWYEESYGV